MKSWPPSIPATEKFYGAFMHMKENVKHELSQRDTSAADRNLAQYMRTMNVGTRLIKDTEAPYKGQLVVSFDTVTARVIRPKLLRVFSVCTDGDDIFTVPTAVAHAAVNGVSKREAVVLADELVGGFYDEYEIARMAGVSAKELRKIFPKRYEEQLHRIYDEIRGRALGVVNE